MTEKYTDIGVEYELREKKKCKSGDKDRQCFSLMAIRSISSNNIFLVLKDGIGTYESVFPRKTRRGKTRRGKTRIYKGSKDILCVAIRELLLDYIEQKKANYLIDHSKIRLAGKFVETLEASLKLFPPIDKVDVSPSGRETVYYFQRIA